VKAEMADHPLERWLAEHDDRLDRFKSPIPISVMSQEAGLTPDETRQTVADPNTAIWHLWKHTYRGKTRRTKPYCLRINGPDTVGLDWEHSVVGAAAAEFRRRGYATALEVGTPEHMELLRKTPELGHLIPGTNQRDLVACRTCRDERERQVSIRCVSRASARSQRYLSIWKRSTVSDHFGPARGQFVFGRLL